MFNPLLKCYDFNDEKKTIFLYISPLLTQKSFSPNTLR